MLKVNKRVKAIQVFYDYERLENRLPTKDEFDLAYYGRKLRRGESNWYYNVRKRYLMEREF